MLIFLFLSLFTFIQSTTVTLSGDYAPVELPYSGAAGDILTISARSLASEPIDVTLEFLLDNQRIAFNDDHHAGDSSGLAAQDAMIDQVVLPEAGEYVIRVNSFNGAQTGEVEITIDVHEPLPLCETQTIQLEMNERFGCQLQGEAFRITARDLAGTLDPLVSVYAANELAASNDDHNSDDATLNTLDARLEFSPQAEQVYTLYISDFAGAAGSLELTIEIVS